MDDDDAAAFIRANTRLLAVPLRPDIRLYQADEVTSLWAKTEVELAQSQLPPPFWAFAWAGGQALARYLAEAPGVVAGRRILDFASGSGLVAIASAKAGAASVEAADIDPVAAVAIGLNAAVNQVELTICNHDLLSDAAGTSRAWDVVLAGDIFYERDTAARVTSWLQALAQGGAPVLIGDPRRAYLPREKLVQIVEYEVPVSRDLEGVDVKQAGVWRLEP